LQLQNNSALSVEVNPEVYSYTQCRVSPALPPKKCLQRMLTPNGAL